MNRILTFAILLAFLTLVMAPALPAACHDSDDRASHHESDCDCGCICHISVNALVKTEAMDIQLTTAKVRITYHYPELDPPTKSLDRPPKQSF